MAPGGQAVPVASADAIAVLESRAITFLAGAAAARRCLRGSEPGWRRMRTADEVRAFHECGHALARRCAGEFNWALSIIPDDGVRLGKNGFAGGFSWGGLTPEPLGPIERPARIDTDFREAARICLALSLVEPAPGVRAAILVGNRLRAKTRALVEKEWPLIARLAAELVEHRELGGAEIQRILGSRSNGRGRAVGSPPPLQPGASPTARAFVGPKSAGEVSHG